MTCQVPAAGLAHDQTMDGGPLLGLAHFAPQAVAPHNRLHRRCAPWHATVGGQDLTVDWAVGGAVPTDVIAIALTLGDRELELRLPAELLALGDIDNAPASGKGCDALLLELAWLGWIEPLEALLGEPIRVTAATRPPAVEIAADIAVAMQVQLGQQPAQTVELRMGAAAALPIAAWLEQHATPLSDPLEALRLWLAVEAAEAPLTLGQLRSLQPRDVVMLDPLADRQVRLCLGSRQAGARYETTARRTDAEHLECLAPLIAVDPDRNDVMTQSTAAADLDVSLDDLPLKLVCQIGSVELSLAQLREMGPGSLLQLTATAQDGVDLMVNGRRVGRGELVTIGEGLGVRLLGFTAP